jgi:hypothetical protein
VAGAGGAAHAVVFACLSAGARRVTIGNRTPSAAADLAVRFEAVGSSSISPMALDDPAFSAALESADLAVNATTVGMLDAGMTIDIDRLPPGATVFDLVYVPRETPLLWAARARGLRAANGSEMLIQQAAIAFERWTGVGGMADVMRAAGRAAARRRHRPRLTMRLATIIDDGRTVDARGRSAHPADRDPGSTARTLRVIAVSAPTASYASAIGRRTSQTRLLIAESVELGPASGSGAIYTIGLNYASPARRTTTYRRARSSTPSCRLR